MKCLVIQATKAHHDGFIVSFQFFFLQNRMFMCIKNNEMATANKATCPQFPKGAYKIGNLKLLELREIFKICLI